MLIVMNCIACGKPLEEIGYWPLSCKNCGALNNAPNIVPNSYGAIESEALTVPADQPAEPKRSRLSKSVRYIVIGLALVVIVACSWLILQRIGQNNVVEVDVTPLSETSPDTNIYVDISPTPGPSPTPEAISLRDIRKTSTAAADDLAQATTLMQAQTALQAFLDQYDVQFQMITVNPSDYVQTWDTFRLLTEADLPSIKQYGAWFIDEWAKYPIDWVSSADLDSIVFVTDMFVSVNNSYWAAMPDPIGDAVYYDPSYVEYGESYCRETIHHEFNHVLSYNYFGDWAPYDPIWEALNPPGFSYGEGGAVCYLPGNTCLTGEHPILGFVTGYATSGMSEDRAELYAYLMTSQPYRNLLLWIETDPYLAAKVENYKEFISSHSPEMSGTYFDDINL
jgi:hypothetical protein